LITVTFLSLRVTLVTFDKAIKSIDTLLHLRVFNFTADTCRYQLSLIHTMNVHIIFSFSLHGQVFISLHGQVRVYH